MSINIPFKREKAKVVVKEALETMETIDEYADEGSQIVATHDANRFGGEGAKMTIKFLPDGNSTEITYEFKKGNPIDITTKTDEIETDFRSSIQQLRGTPIEEIENQRRLKEVERATPVTFKEGVGEAVHMIKNIGENSEKENRTNPSKDAAQNTHSTAERNVNETTSMADPSYCPSCGAKVSNNDEFCSSCGTELSTSVPSDSDNQHKDDKNDRSKGEINEQRNEGQVNTNSEGQIGSSPGEPLTEQITDGRNINKTDNRNKQTEKPQTPTTDDTEQSAEEIAGQIIQLIVGLIFLAIGMWLALDAIGLAIVNII